MHNDAHDEQQLGKTDRSYLLCCSTGRMFLAVEEAVASLFDSEERAGAALMRAAPVVLLLTVVLAALTFGRALCAELHRFIVLFRWLHLPPHAPAPAHTP